MKTPTVEDALYPCVFASCIIFIRIKILYHILQAGDRMVEPYIYKLFKMKELYDQNTAKIEDGDPKYFVNEEVQGSIYLTKQGLSLSEDVDKALFTYPWKHYYDWADVYQLDTIQIGDIGENVSVLEMDEYSVFLGDTYQVGEAVIQVSQPYLPTWRLAKHLQMEDFALQMQQSGRTGWYFRVLQEGDIQAEQDMELLDRPYPQWSLAACNEVMHRFREDLRLADDLLQCDVLGKTWKTLLKKRLRGIPLRTKSRLFGPK